MNLKKSREQFFRLLDAARGQRILDVGAGKGTVAQRVLLASGADVYAIDPEEKRIEFMRERYHGVKCQVGTAENIPFADSFFDRVYTSMALHHFTDVKRALGEF
jgi:ubiquinone/menaquinone biosynthesis C-methylase UbiE